MKVILSKEADQDIADIYDYSISQFGLKQTDKYVERIVKTIEILGDFPKSGLLRDEISAGLYGLLSGSHLIFYTLQPNHILIVRVLHQSRDLPNEFE